MTHRAGVAFRFFAALLVARGEPNSVACQEPSPHAGRPITNGAGQPSLLPGQVLPASSERPFDTWALLLPYRAGVEIWVRNPTADSVFVTRITLAGCLNLATICGPTDLHLVLGHNDSAATIILRPRIWDQRYEYRVAWEWSLPAEYHPDVDEGGHELHLPIESWVLPSAERQQVTIMARNTSQDTVVVTRVDLTECENLRVGCGSTFLNIRLAPGDSARTATFQPARWGEPYGFHLGWQWTIPAPRSRDSNTP